jgi:thymidylate synthase (FAD)
MKFVNPSVVIEAQDWGKILQRIETKGRVCYKSEERITDSSSVAFIGSLIKRGHLSVLEHASVSVKFIVDRGVSHEIVRHRLASYSQESTRYCNYGNDDNGITVIRPFFWINEAFTMSKWLEVMKKCENGYLDLLKLGASAQEARSVLPNSLKTEIWMTADIREWLHFFSVRAAKAAHPQMRQVAIPLLLEFSHLMPAIFGDADFDRDFPIEHYAEVVCEAEEEECINSGPYTLRILERLEKQTQKGMEKYGATLDQNPLGLSTAQVVEYALEEVTDLPVYLEKVKDDVGGDQNG